MDLKGGMRDFLGMMGKIIKLDCGDGCTTWKFHEYAKDPTINLNKMKILENLNKIQNLK